MDELNGDAPARPSIDEATGDSAEAPAPGRCSRCGAAVERYKIRDNGTNTARVVNARTKRVEVKASGPVHTRWHYHLGFSWSRGELTGAGSQCVTLPAPIEDRTHVEFLEHTLASSLKVGAVDRATGAAILGEELPVVAIITINELRVE